MKKFISKLLILAVIMSTFIPTTVYADTEEYIDTQYTSSYEGEMDVEYHVYSSYNVTVPVSISQYDTSATVTVNMSAIEDGYHIEMSVTNVDDWGCITVTSADGEDTAKLAVMYDGGMYPVDYTGLFAIFYPADYTADASMDISLSLYETAKGGIYSGTLCYRIECVQD